MWQICDYLMLCKNCNHLKYRKYQDDVQNFVDLQKMCEFKQIATNCSKDCSKYCSKLRSFGDYLRRGTCIFAVIIFGGQSRPPSNCYPFYCNIMHKNAAAASGHCHCPSQRGRRLSPASLQGGGADKEGSAKTTLSGGWRGVG